MASQHSHVAKVIEHAAANPKSLKSGESAAIQAAASFVGAGPGPSMPLLPPPKVWHEALSPEGYSYYWNVETNGRLLNLDISKVLIKGIVFVLQKLVGKLLLRALCHSWNSNWKN